MVQSNKVGDVALRGFNYYKSVNVDSQNKSHHI